MEQELKIKILIVDDEVELAEILEERLNFRGFYAKSVVDHIQAIREAEKTKYDVALIDVKLKGMNGIELMKLLLEMNPELKVILFTGHGSEGEGKRGLESGAVRYLFKPIDLEKLISEINDILKS